MKKALIFLAAAAVFSLKTEVLCQADLTKNNASVTEPKIVWSEKFEKDGSLVDNGYKQTCDNKKDQITVQDGVLTMVCQKSPYKGCAFTKNIPGLLRGELTFEASTGSGAGYDHMCLYMSMGGMSFCWRANTAWHLYHPKEKKWHPLTTRVSNGVWHKYKISFDAVNHTAEFFVDDMENPVFIDEKSEYAPADKVVFRIVNYGLCSGTIVNKLKNIELKAVPGKKKVTKEP